jgi:hypothetical protein
VPEPVATLDRHAAASGVAVLHGSAVVAEWAKGRVLRVRLRASGAAPSGAPTTLLTGIEHPMPVMTDGTTLLVGDWQSGRIFRFRGA